MDTVKKPTTHIKVVAFLVSAFVYILWHFELLSEFTKLSIICDPPDSDPFCFGYVDLGAVIILMQIIKFIVLWVFIYVLILLTIRVKNGFDNTKSA